MFISRKRKCSRRSSSFSSLEEMIWRKEIAVTCLMSAAETKPDYQETELAIHQVVDELYSKLSNLNLTSGKKSVTLEHYVYNYNMRPTLLVGENDLKFYTCICYSKLV